MTFDLKKFDPQDADDFIDIALDGLGVIAGLVGGKVGDGATEVLKGVKAVVATILSGYDGKVTFEQARDELKKFTDNLAANDAKADDALRRKFDTSDVGAPEPEPKKDEDDDKDAM